MQFINVVYEGSCYGEGSVGVAQANEMDVLSESVHYHKDHFSSFRFW